MPMKNPYDVLGISASASIEEVKVAYKKLAARYQTEVSSPQDFEKKMNEIDSAYDTIILTRSENDFTRNNASKKDFSSDLNRVREKIKEKRIDDAEMQLDNIPTSQRTAEWYYLKGVINNNRGWFEEAKKNYTIACQMEPSNAEYQNAFNSISSSSEGAYRASRRKEYAEKSGTSFCNLCNALICADCCCDCLCGNSRGCC